MTPKTKMRRRLSVVDVIRERFREAFQELRGISGQISQLGHMLDALKARIPDPSAKAERFGEAVPVTHWLISPPDMPPIFAPREQIRTGGNELGRVLVELAHRVETLHETGRIAILIYNEPKGKLELWCRERIR